MNGSIAEFLQIMNILHKHHIFQCSAQPFNYLLYDYLNLIVDSLEGKKECEISKIYRHFLDQEQKTVFSLYVSEDSFNVLLCITASATFFSAPMPNATLKIALIIHVLQCVQCNFSEVSDGINVPFNEVVRCQCQMTACSYERKAVFVLSFFPQYVIFALATLYCMASSHRWTHCRSFHSCLSQRRLKDRHICCHGDLQVMGQLLIPAVQRACLLSTSANKIKLMYAPPCLVFVSLSFNCEKTHQASVIMTLSEIVFCESHVQDECSSVSLCLPAPLPTKTQQMYRRSCLDCKSRSALAAQSKD